MHARHTPSIAFPLAVGEDRRTQLVLDHGAAVEQLIEQLVFTRPGERLNQPELGCDIGDLVFGGLSDELVAATQFTISGELARWLGDVLRIISVQAVSHESRLDITVSYALLPTGEARSVTVSR